MKKINKIICTAVIVASTISIAGCDAEKAQETAAAPVQAYVASVDTVEPATLKAKPALALFSPSTGMIHVLLKPRSAPADMVYKNACPAGSQPFGVSDINFGGKLFCNDASNRQAIVMDLSTSAELFRWSWSPEIQGTPIWFIGRWQSDKEVGLAAYDSAKGIFQIFNSADKNFTLSHSFEYGGSGASTLPLVGDWNGDGTDSAGVYRATTKQVFLRNALDAGMADISFGLDQGNYEPDATPIAINLDEITAVAMYSSKAALVVSTSADKDFVPFLFGAPEEPKVVVPVR